MDDGILIEQVSLFPQLFAKSDPRYKNLRAKENAWKSIAIILDETPEACEHRWKILRNKYTTLKRQVKCTPSGSAATEINWPYFDNMRFLDPYLLTRRSYSNLNLKRKPEAKEWDTMSTIMEENFSESYGQENSPDTNMNYEDRPGTSHDQTQTSNTGPGKTPIPRYTMPARKKQKTDILADKITGCFDSFQKVLTSTNQPSAQPEINTDEHFVKSVVEDLKVFSNKEKILIKRDIYNVLARYLESVDSD